MRVILILLGLIWIVIGVLLFIFIDASKEVLRNLLKQKNIRVLSILALVIGIVLILGSPAVNLPWFTIILGILSLLKGLFFIFAPAEKTKSLIDWWLNASNVVCRSWGVMTFLIGVLLLLIL